MIEIEIDNDLKTVLKAGSEDEALGLMALCDCGYKLRRADTGKVFFIKMFWTGRKESKTRRKA